MVSSDETRYVGDSVEINDKIYSVVTDNERQTMIIYTGGSHIPTGLWRTAQTRWVLNLAPRPCVNETYIEVQTAREWLLFHHYDNEQTYFAELSEDEHPRRVDQHRTGSRY